MVDVGSLATPQKRAIAYMIDDFAMGLLFFVIYYDQISLLQTPQHMANFIAQNSWVLIMLKLFYHTLFVWQSGMTLGKYMMKVKVISLENGGLLTLPSALVRSLVRIFGEMVFYITFLPVFFTPLRQTLHDRLSRSVVVYA